MSNVKHIVELFVYASSAESGPPLGTVLGNIGLNTSKFCKDFNDFTKDLPNYFYLKVRIFIFDNRTFSFVIFKPSTSFILSLLKMNKVINIKKNYINKNKFCFGVNVIEIFKLVSFIFKSKSKFNYFKICWATLISMGLYIFTL